MHLLINILRTYRCRSLCGIGNSEDGAGVVGHKVQEHSFPSFGSAVQRLIDVVDQWKCQDNGGGVREIAIAILAIITTKCNIGEYGLKDNKVNKFDQIMINWIFSMANTRKTTS
jgi:hypothetical protein